MLFLTNLASTDGPNEISRRAACGPRVGQHCCSAIKLFVLVNSLISAMPLMSDSEAGGFCMEQLYSITIHFSVGHHAKHDRWNASGIQSLYRFNCCERVAWLCSARCSTLIFIVVVGL